MIVVTHLLKEVKGLYINRPQSILTLNTASLNFNCGTPLTNTFVVSVSSNVTCSKSFLWNLGTNNGWMYNNAPAPSSFTTPTNTITLTSANGNILPSNVSVTPIINGINYPVLTCTNSFAPFVSNAVVNGNLVLCVGNNSIYTISGLASGNIITWSSSNLQVATLSTGNQSQVTVNGISNGLTTITATITNQCGQVTTKSKIVNIGAPFLQNGIVTGLLWVKKTYNLPIPISFPTVLGATNYVWSIGPGEFGFPCPNAVATMPKFANGLQTFSTTTPTANIKTGTCTGTYKIYCNISNSCGSILAYDRDLELVAKGTSPCNPIVIQPNLKTFIINQNPVKNGKLYIQNNQLANIEIIEDTGGTTSNILNDELPCFIEYPQVYIPLPGTGKQITSTIEIQIYDMNGNKVYQKNVDKNQNNYELDIQHLKPSNYILYISQNGIGEKQIIIIE